MENNTSLRYYSVFVKYNPSIQYSKFDEITKNVQNYFLKFLNENDYGDNLIPMSFYFLTEKEIDFNKQDDVISTSTYLGISKNARLSVHINYDYINSIPEDIQYKLTLNGILYLLNCWNENLKIPKGTPLEDIIINYKNKLENDNLLDESFIPNFIKVNNPFRFYFMRNYFYGLKDKHILFDTNDIEKYLNNNLYNINFGNSIREVFLSYDIFDFDNPGHKQYIDDEKEYKYGKNKDLCIMEQYDKKLFYQKTKYEQIAYLHKGMLKSIERIEQMKRKPKNFNHEWFYKTIDKLMKEYEENNK